MSEGGGRSYDGWTYDYDRERERAEELAADDWRKEDCACGHGRTLHAGGVNACSGTTSRPDMAGLPAPQYAPGTHPDDFLAVPVNWPYPLPRVQAPCSCASFADPEPVNPED